MGAGVATRNDSFVSMDDTGSDLFTHCRRDSRTQVEIRGFRVPRAVFKVHLRLDMRACAAHGL